MANHTLNSTLESFISSWPAPSWELICINQMRERNFTFNEGLRGQSGQPEPNLHLAWGVSYGVCATYCNDIAYADVFSFQTFSSTLTNYFLPWLALTAQLPFESGDRFRNLMSFFMAVGSPALATYSLVLTLLNRRWISQVFRKLKNEYAERGIKRPELRGFKRRLAALQFLLQETMQVPLRISQNDDAFARIIAFPQKSAWLQHLHKRLQNTRRGITPSLFAQMFLAVITYLFVVIATFGVDLGVPEVALQIASGSLWIWLVPVVSGWITVGTQIGPHTIRDALAAKDLQMERPTSSELGNDDNSQSCGLYISGDSGRNFDPEIIVFKGFEVNGDERELGPIFNYARVFTWAQLTKNVTDSLNIVQRRREDVIQAGNNNGSEKTTCNDLATYCGLDGPTKIYPSWSLVDSDLFSAKLKQRIMSASCMALFVQWGTTGASILIAYLTPPAGLGCRSASYLLYGVLATLAWLLLMLSSLASEHCMLTDQTRAHSSLDSSQAVIEKGRSQAIDDHESCNDSNESKKAPTTMTVGEVPVTQGQAIDIDNIQRLASVRPTTPSTSSVVSNQAAEDYNTPTFGAYQIQAIPLQDAHSNQGTFRPQDRIARNPSLRDKLWYATAIGLRLSGKSLAVLNALWLIVSSLLEFLGVFDTCTCQSNHLFAGDRAWVILFKGSRDPQVSAIADSVGAGGLSLSMATCIIAIFLLYMASVRSPSRER